MSTSVVGLMLPGIAETPLSAVMVDCAYAGTLQTNSNATTLLKAKTRPAFRGIDMPPFSIELSSELRGTTKLGRLKLCDRGALRQGMTLRGVHGLRLAKGSSGSTRPPTNKKP